MTVQRLRGITIEVSPVAQAGREFTAVTPDAAVHDHQESPPKRSPKPPSQELFARVLNRVIPTTRADHLATPKAAARVVFSRAVKQGLTPKRCQVDANAEKPLPKLDAIESADSIAPPNVTSPASSGFGVGGRGIVREHSEMQQPCSAHEVIAFRTSLTKSFGNLTRAFRAMKAGVAGAHGVAGRKGGSNNLTAAEFEWCVIAHLKYGDRQLARQLFKALDVDNKGEIGAMELARHGSASESVVSLVELRRHLLERHSGSLARAFRELEDHLDSQRLPANSFNDHSSAGRARAGRSGRSVRRPEFVEAFAFFGLDAGQATHFFEVLDTDGNGNLTLDEFLEALTHMPREVLLQDFRQRVLARYETVTAAFHTISGDAAQGMSQYAFIGALAKLGIVEMEAVELFRIIDGDGSGDVCLPEFKQALREVAPSADLETFWQRFAVEWPEITTAATQSRGRSMDGLLDAARRFDEVLQGLMPPSSPQPKRWRASPLETLVTSEGFDTIAARLDVSPQDTSRLWAQIREAANGRRGGGYVAAVEVSSKDGSTGLLLSLNSAQLPGCVALAGSVEEVYAEDFLEQLRLWVDHPLSCRVQQATTPKSVRVCSPTANSGAAPAQGRGIMGLSRRTAEQRVLEVGQPLKAAISALKAEITSARNSEMRPLPSGRPAPCGGRSPPVPAPRRRKRVKLPWCTNVAPAFKPTPVLFV